MASTGIDGAAVASTAAATTRPAPTSMKGRRPNASTHGPTSG